MDWKQDWLELKRNFVGASDTATLFGVNPWDTTLALWGRKTGRIAPKQMTEQMEVGELMEPVTAALYCRRTGRSIYPEFADPKDASVHRFGPMAMYSLNDCPLSCTPDRLIAPIQWRGEMQMGTCQLKNTNFRMEKDWALDENGVSSVPLHVQMQVQAEMAVLGCAWGSAAVVIGGCDFRCADIERNEAFIQSLMVKAAQFMWYVKNDKQPPDLSPDDRDTLNELYPEHTPGKVIALPDEAGIITERYELAKAAMDHNESIVEHCKAQIQAMLGDAEKGIVPGDGGAWTWKHQAACEVKAFTRKASRPLRRTKK